MSWNNDAHGIALKSKKIEEIKIYNPSHTWSMKLSQLGKQEGKTLYVLTYSIDNKEPLQVIEKRPCDIVFVCHSKFQEEAEEIASEFPKIKVYIHDELHAKLVAYEPKTVYIGSSNFTKSSWVDCNVGIRSKEAFNWCKENIIEPVIKKARRIRSYR